MVGRLVDGDRFSNRWPVDEDMADAITASLEIAERSLSAGGFSVKERSRIVEWLMLRVADKLPRNFRSVENREETLNNALEEALNDFLGLYYANLNSVDFDANFEIQEGFQELNFSIKTLGSDLALFNRAVMVGEWFKYGEYTFKIEKDQNGQFALNVKKILKPDQEVTFRFDPRIDVQKITQVASIEESAGWEKAFDLIHADVLPKSG